ncbi:hypothetical protein [Microbacterium alcoholitolerans]|uniref:hypothetical protein n=1 Tax=unclassified Microbacterium TaxID=2609290 RepID=UPI003D16BE66
MGRKSIILNHPQKPRIDAMLDDGVPYERIAREMGLALSTVGRYALLRRGELAKLLDDVPGVVTVLNRLLETADHARDIRRITRVTGSPVAQARAIKSELEVLGKLITDLQITDTTITEVMAQTEALVTAIRAFGREYPSSAEDLIQTMERTPGAEQLAIALRRGNRKLQ